MLIALTKNTTVASAIGVAEAALLMNTLIENEADKFTASSCDLRRRIHRPDPADRPAPRLARKRMAVKR